MAPRALPTSLGSYWRPLLVPPNRGRIQLLLLTACYKFRAGVQYAKLDPKNDPTRAPHPSRLTITSVRPTAPKHKTHKKKFRRRFDPSFLMKKRVEILPQSTKTCLLLRCGAFVTAVASQYRWKSKSISHEHFLRLQTYRHNT